MLIAFYTLIALLFGSFTNVLIYRAAKSISIIKPDSFCPECKHPLAWLEKLPLISYLILGGKCKNCKTKIPFLYPLVELAVPLLSIKFIIRAAENSALLQQINTSFPEQTLAQTLNFIDFLFPVILISITIALAVIDQKHHILPHSLTYSGIIAGVIFISLFGTSFYESSEIFTRVFDGYLTGLLASLMQLGIVFFSLDTLTHFVNSIYYKKDALSISSSGLTLGIKFLEDKITIVYLLLIILILSLLMNFQDLALHYLFVLIGASYLFNEILRDFFFAQHDQSISLEENKKTVLGGGDVAMIAMIAVIFGLTKTLLIVLISFYILFVFLMFKFIKIFFQAAFNKESEQKLTGLELLKKNLARHIPLGGALAVSFITAMMIFS